MPDSIVLDKANPLKPGEDYDLLRKEGIKRIEKLDGDVWTDYNTHDPGITLLEALCYAITDLSYRTGFDMKDLVAPETLKPDSWKQLFYTAREILPCNSLTINDFRRILLDIPGIRNAWITISKDCEVPIYITYPEFSRSVDNESPCGDPDKMLVPLSFSPDPTSPKHSRIIELNGLYKIIIEFDENIVETHEEEPIREKVVAQLHQHRNLCEDYLSVTAVEYRDFILSGEILLKDTADAEMVLAEMCFRIQNYFTPGTKFYTLEELLEKGMRAEEIFEGPFLVHGFIPDEELDRNDLFRDMRLSDIINSVADIDEVVAFRKFKINDPLTGTEDMDDTCSNETFFDEWIAGMKNERLVGRLDIENLAAHVNDKDVEEGGVEILAPLKVMKGNDRVIINTDRFRKLLKDLKTLDRNKKLVGQSKDFIVPVGENLHIADYYPIQYSLPETYKVDENGLPMKEGNKRLAQALQLKGYLAVFEQMFMNFLAQLANINELFSFKEIDRTSFTQQIVHYDNSDKPQLTEEIIGYLHLYISSEQYIKKEQEITEAHSLFETRRNCMLDHLLARFGEELDEYGLLMKYLYPNRYLPLLIKNKTDLLSDYFEISCNRGRAYNYQLEEEWLDDPETDKDEVLIAQNISGTEKRISRLIGMKDYQRKNIAPDNFILEYKDPNDHTTGWIRLYEDGSCKHLLLETEEIETECEDEIMHCFIESGCCQRNFFKYPEQKDKIRRKKYPAHGYGFVLKDDKLVIVASSPTYKTKEERDAALKKAIAALKKICHNEGMHLVEHILLRPRGDDVVEVVVPSKKSPPATQNLPPIPYELLDVCIDQCDQLNLASKRGPDSVLYKFDITKLKLEDCEDNKRWVVELKRLFPDVNPPAPNLIFSITFREYERASAFISTIREYGSEFSNYKVYKTDDSTTTFFFRLFDKKGKLLFETEGCYKKAKPTAFFTKKDFREDEKTGNDDIYTKTDDCIEEISNLKRFLAFELDLYCCEDPCDHNEDPYSFRVTYVLPCWPKRFRDKRFRNFVERTIYAETPAHIHPKIYWVGVELMRKFESAWIDWRIEIALNDVPDNKIASDFIKVVKELKNCDQPCKKKEI